MNARASFTAIITFSVPELPKRIRSMDDTRFYEMFRKQHFLCTGLGPRRAALHLVTDRRQDAWMRMAVDERCHVVDEIEALDTVNVRQPAS